MTARYRVLPAADRDLDDQAAYLASQASLETALRFYDAAALPSPGSPACPASASAGHRRTPAWPACGRTDRGFEKHLIFYRRWTMASTSSASSTRHATSMPCLTKGSAKWLCTALGGRASLRARAQSRQDRREG